MRVAFFNQDFILTSKVVRTEVRHKILLHHNLICLPSQKKNQIIVMHSGIFVCKANKVKGVTTLIFSLPENNMIAFYQVFFRAGVLGMMEEIREEKIAQILTWLQSVVRGHMSRATYQKLKAQKVRS